MLSPFPAEATARSQAVGIAADRIEHLSGDAKSQMLGWIDAALDVWKWQQADANGEIELQPLESIGLLGPLAPLSKVVDPPARAKVSQLRPDQCAGPWVRCSADLFVKLWGERFDAIVQIEQELGLDIVMALLVERDGKEMPIDSLALAVRYIWIYVWALAGASAAILRKMGTTRAHQMAAARQASAISRAETKRRNQAAWRQMAADFYRADIRQKRLAVAFNVRDALARQQIKPLPPVDSIDRAIKGVRQQVIEEGLRISGRRA
jgi:hypothetical protein